MRRTSKYGAIKVKDPVHGTFDSKKEFRRWHELLALQGEGEITHLARQQTYSLDINGQHICNYVADFVYFRRGKRIVEDAKGVITREFALKKKLMRAILNIEVEVT